MAAATDDSPPRRRRGGQWLTGPTGGEPASVAPMPPPLGDDERPPQPLLPTWEYLVMAEAFDQGRAARGRFRYSVSKPWSEVYAPDVLAAAQAQAVSPLLETLGADGWELTGVTDTGPVATNGPAFTRGAVASSTTFYFKRRGAGSLPRWREDEWWWWRW